MEDVWIGDLSTNGFKVTRHYFDAFGRETNTVVGIAHTPGEATSSASVLQSESSVLSTFYPDAGSDYSAATDARGKVEVRQTSHLADRDVIVTDVYADEASPAPSSETVETEWRNGPSAVRRSWDGRWTERRTWSDYCADGCRVDFEVTESSDCGVVTNSVSWCDFLGRTVRVETPEGTITLYAGIWIDNDGKGTSFSVGQYILVGSLGDDGVPAAGSSAHEFPIFRKSCDDETEIDEGNIFVRILYFFYSVYMKIERFFVYHLGRL